MVATRIAAGCELGVVCSGKQLTVIVKAAASSKLGQPPLLLVEVETPFRVVAYL